MTKCGASQTVAGLTRGCMDYWRADRRLSGFPRNWLETERGLSETDVQQTEVTIGLTEELKKVSWERTCSCQKSAGADRALTNNTKGLTEELLEVARPGEGLTDITEGQNEGLSGVSSGWHGTDRPYCRTDLVLTEATEVNADGL